MQLNIHILVAATLLCALVSSQTPPGTSPSTDNNLAVSYGTTMITPGIMLPPMTTSTIPTINFKQSSPNQTFTLLLVDLSILPKGTSGLDPTYQLPLAPGVSPNRTTRLHYWQAGLTFTANGTLVNSTEPVAFYQGPAPPPGDIAHTYAFYLFEQEAGFMAPPAESPFNVANVNKGMNRMSFNVPNFAKENGVGPLVAGNYILVQNTTTASGTGSASATGTAVMPTSMVFVGDAGIADMSSVVSLVMAAGIGTALLLA